MKKVDDYLKKKKSKDLDLLVKKNFKLAMENESFANLCYKLDVSEDVLMKYTSKLECSVNELGNCKGCKGLEFCKNPLIGFVDFPQVNEDYLVFSYVPCKFKKEKDKYKSYVSFYETPKILREARLGDIFLDDKSREEVLQYVKSFMKEYPNKKGVYLHGSFGTGKSFIVNAILNELSRKGSKCVSVYYPLLLKKLKDSFNKKTGTYEQIYNELEFCDVLLIDDIGAENNSPWARDEVLGGILQSRMDNERITFFTSNFNLSELESHLSETSSSSDKIKARRIIERIKQLSVPIELVGESKRN
jgi:primosomal protein DnaI